MQILRESECLKIKLLYMASHELCTLLASINGLVTMLLELNVKWSEKGTVG